jgi:hypothetical protein
VRNGLDPVAVVIRNEHGCFAAAAFGTGCGKRQDTSETDH